jgi:hypothetical protein
MHNWFCFMSLGLLILVRAWYQHNTKLIFNTVHFYCLRIVNVCSTLVLRIFKILKDQWAMHFPLQCNCVCLQAGRPKWVRAQDLKHRINYVRPYLKTFPTTTNVIGFQSHLNFSSFFLFSDFGSTIFSCAEKKKMFFGGLDAVTT